MAEKPKCDSCGKELDSDKRKGILYIDIDEENDSIPEDSLFLCKLCYNVKKDKAKKEA